MLGDRVSLFSAGCPGTHSTDRVATCLPPDTAQCLLQTQPALNDFCFISSYAKTVRERSQGFAEAQQAFVFDKKKTFLSLKSFFGEVTGY